MTEDRRGWLTTGEPCIDDSRRYDRIGALFNHTNVWINCQSSDIIGTLMWDLHNPLQWTPFISEVGVIRSIIQTFTR
jgi:hypothetical protein